MKRYAVLRWSKLQGWAPTVVFVCNDESDAKDYAGIMSRQDDYVYSVAEVIFTIGG